MTVVTTNNSRNRSSIRVAVEDTDPLLFHGHTDGVTQPVTNAVTVAVTRAQARHTLPRLALLLRTLSQTCPCPR